MPKQGQTLSTSNGTWSGSPTSYTYKWQVCTSGTCYDISGATSSSYQLTASDVSSTVRVVVTAANSGGQASATSSQTSSVATIPAVSAGDEHSCALLSNGTVKCFGYNYEGQLGNGTQTDSATPVSVSGIYDAVSVSAGYNHTCAVLASGQIACWGDNYDGDLGDGTVYVRFTPVLVSGITNAVQVAAGRDHTCARLTTGYVQCWGANELGQLGDGISNHGQKDINGWDYNPSPVTVSTGFVLNATSLASGSWHSCAVLQGGSVECWGWGLQLPAAQTGISSAVQVAAGTDSSNNGHTCVVLSGGTVQCWGDDSYGQLGDGTTAGSGLTTVVGVGGTGTLTNVVQVTAGRRSTCALIQGGTIDCWGYDYFGEMGNGTTPLESLTPVAVSGITSATQIAAGGLHTCAQLAAGALKCWGANTYGQLGDPTNTGSAGVRNTPVQVKGVGGVGTLANATQVSVGVNHSCALLGAGTIACWGWNHYGQIGNGTTTSSLVPLTVAGVGGVGNLSGVAQISASNDFTCALLSGGTVVCWGENNEGQLGNGGTSDSSTPVQVKGVGGTGSLSNVSAISAGAGHTCALIQGGTVVCWGDNYNGDLGNGFYDSSSTPVQVEGVGGTGSLSNVSTISAGGEHTCATSSDHTLVCWGANDEGQLGSSGISWSLTPAAVSGISTATQVAAGGYHTCARLSDGTVMCWGADDDGQIGSSGYGGSTPAQVVGVGGQGTLANVTQVAAGGSHTCAVISDGTIACWGFNASGQLGNGSSVIRPWTTVLVSGISTATQVSAGQDDTCEVTSLGTIWCWGSNLYDVGAGLLGAGELGYSSTPVAVVSIP